ncbi:HNH endonuclease [Pseudomonas chlororaphis]|uniref:HNH endonuclease n=1 Tax=Pseudomonas chlororaphis TaxID=587753 RepID=UPI00209B2763|nr:HNH endonuclease signature motif containing protein [Pseudomonas chlororaphis]MCO7573062.1 HNH endonuclease [Pseudomonas chlororaphis]MCO7591579.1 HNH endonuclease [Pseudomonas chlororaphis]
MRVLTQPLYDPLEVLTECISGISDHALVAKFQAFAPSHLVQAAEYVDKAHSANLYKFPSFQGGKADVVTFGVTKGEFYSLYAQYFVGKNKTARVYYDALMVSAPNQKCPYCGFGHVYTLDHYLPKAKFPQFSTLIVNLVPACRDCNEGGKRTSTAALAAEQPLHPYFDRAPFYKVQWLFARVVESTPASVEFYVSCPLSWSAEQQKRVRAHFKAFNLKKRYAVEAAEELSTLSPRLKTYHLHDSIDEIRKQLNETLAIERAKHQNSWMTAMYAALINNDWYCGGGFAL